MRLMAEVSDTIAEDVHQSVRCMERARQLAFDTARSFDAAASHITPTQAYDAYEQATRALAQYRNERGPGYGYRNSRGRSRSRRNARGPQPQPESGRTSY